MSDVVETKIRSDLEKALSSEFGRLAHAYYMEGVSSLEEKVLVEISASFNEGMPLGKVKKHLQKFGIQLSLRDVKSVLVVDAYHAKPNGVTFQSSPQFTING